MGLGRGYSFSVADVRITIVRMTGIPGTSSVRFPLRL